MGRVIPSRKAWPRAVGSVLGAAGVIVLGAGCNAILGNDNALPSAKDSTDTDCGSSGRDAGSGAPGTPADAAPGTTEVGNEDASQDAAQGAHDATVAASDGAACSGAGCVTCQGGADCSDPTTPCVKKAIDCRSGSPKCEVTGKAVDGMGCSDAGPALFCNSGVCSACQVGASCAPPNNICHVGKVTACSGGVPVCTDQGTPASAGASCILSTGVSGVCDGNGTCVACAPNAPCAPSGNFCLSGVQSCSSGPRCLNATPVNEGQSCEGINQICHAGACVACSASSCQNGCCDANGCVTAAQSLSECGDGVSGAICAPCPASTALLNSTCAGNACMTTCTGTQCNGACVDLEDDSQNCGACGHSCLGGACMAGQCRPFVLAAGVQAQHIAIDSVNVYWVNQQQTTGVVGKVPIGGGGPVMLATGQDVPLGLVSDGTNVYWANNMIGSGAVMKVPVGGGTPVTLATSHSPSWVAVDATSVYFTDLNAGTVSSVPIAGGTVQTLVTVPQPDQPFAVAVDANNVYYTTNTPRPTGIVARVPLGGGPQTVLASAQNMPGFLAVDRTNVYWPDFAMPDNTVTTSGTVMTVAIAGGTPKTIATGQSAPSAIAIDATNVYWTVQDTGNILRAPIGGGTPTVIVTGGAVDLKVDTSAVYFTNGSDILILAK